MEIPQRLCSMSLAVPYLAGSGNNCNRVSSRRLLSKNQREFISIRPRGPILWGPSRCPTSEFRLIEPQVPLRTALTKNGLHFLCFESPNIRTSVLLHSHFFFILSRHCSPGSVQT